MWTQMDRLDRFVFIMGTSYVLGAVALLIVLLTFGLAPDAYWGLWTLCVALVFLGTLLIWLLWKEGFMRIGIVERVRERRRIAAATALMERYDGVDLMSTPEAGALPTPVYECGGCGHMYNKTADKMYWVDEQPMLSAGWYCEECVDKLEGKPRHERLNMEIFLIMLDSDLGAD